MSIINTVWWNALGLFLFIGLIAVSIYCLWDLKREERAVAANKSSETPRWRTQTIYLKKSAVIYPEHQDTNRKAVTKQNHLVKGRFSNGN